MVSNVGCFEKLILELGNILIEKRDMIECRRQLLLKGEHILAGYVKAKITGFIIKGFNIGVVQIGVRIIDSRNTIVDMDTGNLSIDRLLLIIVFPTLIGTLP